MKGFIIFLAWMNTVLKFASFTGWHKFHRRILSQYQTNIIWCIDIAERRGYINGSFMDHEFHAASYCAYKVLLIKQSAVLILRSSARRVSRQPGSLAAVAWVWARRWPGAGTDMEGLIFIFSFILSSQQSHQPQAPGTKHQPATGFIFLLLSHKYADRFGKTWLLVCRFYHIPYTFLGFNDIRKKLTCRKLFVGL